MPLETVVECATPTIGEGPHWDDATQSLLWVDIIDGILFRWDSKTGKHETHKFSKFHAFSPGKLAVFFLNLKQIATQMFFAFL